MRNLFFILVVLASAISISGIAAAYSIIGLATLFAGAKVAIIAMGTSLEVGKLVAASWLYQNWKNPSTTINKGIFNYVCYCISICN